MEQGWHTFVFYWSYKLCIKIFSWSRGTGHILHLSELKGAGGDGGMAYREEMNHVSAFHHCGRRRLGREHTWASELTLFADLCPAMSGDKFTQQLYPTLLLNL